MDGHSLRLLEFDRVTAALAARATGPGARTLLRERAPLADPAARTRENALLDEAIRRQREPGPWSRCGAEDLAPRLDERRPEPLDGPGLVEVLAWLEAARDTRALWQDAGVRERFPGLVARVDGIPDLEPLRDRLARSLEPDGRLADGASPELARLRRGLEEGERALQQRLEKWAHGFGESAYVTRHGERFVALVPAAGFPRRRALVHDVSGSGHSLFVEPLEMTDANNQVIELRGGVTEEERRILRELGAAVQRVAPELAALEAALVHLDALRACASWAAEVGAVAIEPRGERLVLRRARHPLLAMARIEVVPLELELAAPARLLLVSGPNMGGKTVLLKTVGLAFALAHAALPVPAAEGSAIPEVDALVADLGDEQSVDEGLSTFAAHLRGLAAMAAAAGPRSLVLCDELGAGTDPEEGAALGRALLEHLAAHGAWGVVTTHLGSLKRAAGEIEGLASGSLEFDPEAMAPRYRFLAGVPGASHALAVAERLGFPPALVERARALAPQEAVALERLLAGLQRRSVALDEERARLAEAEAAARAAEDGARRAAEDARQALEELRRRLTRESEVVLSHARELWQTVQREARRADKTRADAARLGAGIEAADRAVEALQRAAAEALGPGPAPAANGPLEPGRRVRVRDLGVEADVVSGPDAEGRVVLRRGAWSIQSHVGQLEPVRGAGEAGAPAARVPAAGATWESPEEAPGLEADLRGMEAGEALQSLDQALDRAVLAGLSELRIIHGIGRGVLRSAVERHLRAHPQVASHRMGAVGEGGRGVTVARLR